MGFEPVNLLPGIPLNQSLGVWMESYKVQLLSSLIKQTGVLNTQNLLPNRSTSVPPNNLVDFNVLDTGLLSPEEIQSLKIPSQLWQPAASFDKAMASELNLSSEARNVTQLSHDLFNEPAQRDHFLKPLIEISRQYPQVWKPAVVLFSAIKNAGASDSEIGKMIELVKSLALVIKGNPLVIKSEESGLNLFASQVVRQMSAVVAMQPSLPLAQQESPKDLIDFFDFAFKERPTTFEKELSSLPVAQNAGLKLIEYIAVTDQIDPVKLALLIISLKNKKAGSDGTPVLQKFIQDIQKALVEDIPIKSVISDVVKKYNLKDPDLLELIEKKPTEQMRFLAQGVAWVSAGKERYVAALALSPDKGILPDSAWHVMSPNAAMLSVQGGLFLTQHLGPGLQRLRLSVDGDGKDDSVLAELLLYCVQGLSEDEEKFSEEDSQESKQRDSREYQQPEEKIRSPLAGEVSIQLVSPYILTKPFLNNEKVAAPLTLRFRFLADLLQADTKYSREKFLTLKSSPCVNKLRAAVKKLGVQGVSAYDDYLKCVNEVLKEIKNFIPESRETFQMAQKFLRDEVLLYFLGKKSMIELVPFKFAEKTNKGDVLASICAVSSDLLAASGLESDALVEMVDATLLASTKPQFLERIKDFFGILRNRMGATDKTPNLALASEFVKNVNVL